MLVTQEDAQMKRCPSSPFFGATCAGSGCMAWRCGEGAGQTQQQTAVIAEEPMAETEEEAGQRPPEVGPDWVFQPWQELDNLKTLPARWRPPPTNSSNAQPRGYCGLAGKP